MAEEYDLIVSKEGYDWSDTDPTHHILNTRLSQTIKIYAKDTVSVNISSGINTHTYIRIEHNLGFVPLVAVTSELKTNNGKFFFGTALLNDNDVDGGKLRLLPSNENLEETTCVDDTYINLDYINYENVSKTIRLSYLLFADNAR